MIKIKDWDEFQHFKDRSPPWIKLYKTILERRDIAMISDCNFRVLVGLWLLASEDETRQGILPPIEDISFRLRKTEKQINEALQELKPFLIFDDNSVISERYQDGILETETETETEVEGPPKKNKRGVRLPDDWELPVDWGEWARKEKSWPDEKILEEADRFKDHFLAAPGQRGVKIDWFATWRNWIRRAKEYQK